MTLPAHLFSILLSFFVTCVRANTEKTIFLGPEPVSLNNIPIPHSTLSDLHLHTLTPDNGTIHTGLPAQFPSPDHPYGTATWLLLDHLTPSQRYEVRVCWAATVSPPTRPGSRLISTTIHTNITHSNQPHFPSTPSPSPPCGTPLT